MSGCSLPSVRRYGCWVTLDNYKHPLGWKLTGRGQVWGWGVRRGWGVEKKKKISFCWFKGHLAPGKKRVMLQILTFSSQFWCRCIELSHRTLMEYLECDLWSNDSIHLVNVLVKCTFIGELALHLTVYPDWDFNPSKDHHAHARSGSKSIRIFCSQDNYLPSQCNAR